MELVESCEHGKCTQNVGAAAPKDTKIIVANTKLTDVDVEKLLSTHKDVKVISSARWSARLAVSWTNRTCRSFRDGLKSTPPYGAAKTLTQVTSGTIWSST